MNAEIISVGTELLLGQIVDTNAAYLASMLPELGISSYYRTTVGDNPDRLKETIIAALRRSDIVFTIGGLGPTADDITKESIADILDIELFLHEESASRLKAFFKKIDMPMSDNNLKQAMLPLENGTMLYNPVGTAPGVVFCKEFEGENKYVFAMPGPPREFIGMYKESVLPFLKNFIPDTDNGLVSRVIRVFGLGESLVADMLNDLMKSDNPTLAPYVGNGDVILRVTASDSCDICAERLADRMVIQIKDILGDKVYSTDNEDLEDIVIKLCSEKSVKIALAESCTGGMVAQRVTSVSGASKVFLGGIVTYSNDMKMQLLGVSSDVLEKYGAVSSECAKDMAIGIRKVSNSDLGLSITGIAGPDGGTADKPVGLVYIGVSYKDKNLTSKYIFAGDRHAVRLRATSYALNTIREIVISDF